MTCRTLKSVLLHHLVQFLSSWEETEQNHSTLWRFYCKILDHIKEHPPVGLYRTYNSGDTAPLDVEFSLPATNSLVLKKYITVPPTHTAIGHRPCLFPCGWLVTSSTECIYVISENRIFGRDMEIFPGRSALFMFVARARSIMLYFSQL